MNLFNPVETEHQMTLSHLCDKWWFNFNVRPTDKLQWLISGPSGGPYDSIDEAFEAGKEWLQTVLDHKVMRRDPI